MELEHFLPLIPLMVMFIASLIWNRIGFLHLANLAYVLVFGFIAIINLWGIIFLPILLGIGIINGILFFNCMLHGDWI